MPFRPQELSRRGSKDSVPEESAAPEMCDDAHTLPVSPIRSLPHQPPYPPECRGSAYGPRAANEGIGEGAGTAAQQARAGNSTVEIPCINYGKRNRCFQQGIDKCDLGKEAVLPAISFENSPPSHAPGAERFKATWLMLRPEPRKHPTGATLVAPPAVGRERRSAKKNEGRPSSGQPEEPPKSQECGDRAGEHRGREPIEARFLRRRVKPPLNQHR